MPAVFRVASAPVSWGVHEPIDKGITPPYGLILDNMVKSGYIGTELGPYGYFPTDPAKLKAELTKRKLAMLSAFVPVPLGDKARLDEAVQDAVKVGTLLQAFGCQYIVIAGSEDNPARLKKAGRVTARDSLTEEQWEVAAEGLHRVAERCLKLGLRTVLHHHVGTFFETPREIERIMAETEPQLVGLCLDTGHYAFGGGDPVDAVKEFGSRVRYLHFKDLDEDVLAKVKKEKLDFFQAVQAGVFPALGEGCVNFPALVKELAKLNYDGWIIVEQDVLGERDTKGRTTLEMAMASRRYLEEVIGV
ncbi:MAG: TIM barrel protein [Deinococcus sp.]|nr:TIM barrel protein [Deinococcus sp.]